MELLLSNLTLANCDNFGIFLVTNAVVVAGSAFGTGGIGGESLPSSSSSEISRTAMVELSNPKFRGGVSRADGALS
jgi:hypothetical protein